MLLHLRVNSYSRILSFPVLCKNAVRTELRQFSVVNMTRHDARDFLQVASGIGIRPDATIFSLGDANKALMAVKHDTSLDQSSSFSETMLHQINHLDKCHSNCFGQRVDVAILRSASVLCLC